MMASVVEAIAHKWPGAEVSAAGDVVTWHDHSPVPEKSQAEIDQAVAEYATVPARKTKYVEANAEYIKRGVALTGVKVRGSSPTDALTVAAVKETHRGGPKANALATLHDKLDDLKDLIEAAADPARIDVTADAHWI